MIRTKYEESEYGMKMYRKTHGKGSKQIIGNADLRKGKKYEDLIEKFVCFFFALMSNFDANYHL